MSVGLSACLRLSVGFYSCSSCLSALWAVCRPDCQFARVTDCLFMYRLAGMAVYWRMYSGNRNSPWYPLPQVVDIMRVNVDKVLERDQKLSELDDRAGTYLPGCLGVWMCSVWIQPLS